MISGISHRVYVFILPGRYAALIGSEWSMCRQDLPVPKRNGQSTLRNVPEERTGDSEIPFLTKPTTKQIMVMEGLVLTD